MENLICEQKLHIKWLVDAQVKLAHKWWNAPLCLEKLKEQEDSLTKIYRKIAPSVTWDDIVEIYGNHFIQDHNSMDMLANIPKDGGDDDEDLKNPTISFHANVWKQTVYAPKKDHEKEVMDYIEKMLQLKGNSPQEYNSINYQYLVGLQSGGRQVNVPTHLILRNGSTLSMLPNANPCDSILKSGDFIKVEYRIVPFDYKNEYDGEHAGQRLIVSQIFVYSRS